MSEQTSSQVDDEMTTEEYIEFACRKLADALYWEGQIGRDSDAEEFARRARGFAADAYRAAAQGGYWPVVL